MQRQEFVLLSYPRSGGHWLRTALESNPAIQCLPEVFNPNLWGLPYPLSTPVEEVIEGVALKPRRTTVRAVGFVLQAFQPAGLETYPGLVENPRWQGVWDWLAERPGLRVIHLRRQNGLRRALSHRVAIESQVWQRWDRERVEQVSHLGDRPSSDTVAAQPPEPPTVPFTADSLAADFAEAERWHQEARRRLGRRKVLQLTYEDLLEAFDRRTAEIQRFLGVEPRTLRTATHRLETRPLRRSIPNYAMLERQLANGPWSAFFDDDSEPAPPPPQASEAPQPS